MCFFFTRYRVCTNVCALADFHDSPGTYLARGSSLVMHGHALPFMVNFYFSKNVQLYDTVNRVLSQEPSPAEHVRTQQCIHACTTMRTRRSGAIRSQTGDNAVSNWSAALHAYCIFCFGRSLAATTAVLVCLIK